jgi:hypothetical protein
MKEQLELIETQLSLLRSLPYVTAYTGNLKDLKQGTYVSFYEITKHIGRLEKEKRTLLNNEK